MLNSFSSFLLITIVLVVFVSGCYSEKKPAYSITNTTELLRTDELIVLSRADIEKKCGRIATDEFVLVEVMSRPLLVQYDDLNGDGTWDELAFQYNFNPKQEIQVSLSLSKFPAKTESVIRAHVRHRKKEAGEIFGDIVAEDTMPFNCPPTDFSKIALPLYLTEGPAWENDKVAFRLYFDTRNSKDIFGKRVQQMVMDTVGVDPNNSYHELRNWGMDLLHVGRSLGAGSLALELKTAIGSDTLIRVGGEMVKKETLKILANGPVRAICRMTYDCKAGAAAGTVVEDISIWGGQFFYESAISVLGFPEGTSLVTGFANFYENHGGQLDSVGTKAFYSFGRQSEHKDLLGLAIVIPASNFKSFSNLKGTDAIENSYIVSQHLLNGKTNKFRFYAGWELSDSIFLERSSFVQWLTRQTILNGTPLSFK